MFAGQGEGQQIDPKGSPMISETPSSPDDSDELVWGASGPHRVWSRGQTLAAVGVAAVIAAFGGAAIYAAASGSNEMGPGVHGAGRWDGPPGLGDAGLGPDGPRGGAAPLHGEFVVAEDSGGYTTVLMQTGVLTAASDTSITAKSADGFTQTYALGRPAANLQLAVNDMVTVHATLANGIATTTVVAEGGDAGPGGPPPMGSPR
jgi:hypothetical protein